VTIVGYNEETNPPYWIVKNSWSATWGLDGYVYIEKGTNACSITDMAITAFAKKL